MALRTWSAQSSCLIALTYVALFFLTCSAPAPGSIAARVREAKVSGQQRIELGTMHPEAVEATLPELLSMYSLLVATPTKADATRSHDDSDIYTWSIFRIIEVLHRTDEHSKDLAACKLPIPGEISLGEGEVAIPTSGGTISVDGITVSQGGGSWRPTVAGGRYVFFAAICPSRVAILPLYGREVFQVTADDRIVALSRPKLGAFEYQQQVEALGTIQRLKEYLAAR